jgi:hypothetical protein
MRAAASRKTVRPARLPLLGWSLAGVFGLLLALFVMRPDLPTRLHLAMGGEPDVDSQRLVAAPAGEATLVSGDLDALLGDDRLTVDADRALVADWAAQRFPSRALEVDNPTHEGLFTVRRFTLNGGKQVFVFTSLEPEDPYRQSY